MNLQNQKEGGLQLGWDYKGDKLAREWYFTNRAAQSSFIFNVIGFILQFCSLIIVMIYYQVPILLGFNVNTSVFPVSIEINITANELQYD